MQHSTADNLAAGDPPAPDGNLPLELDRLCDEFESGCQSGATPRIEDFLARCPPSHQAKLLANLLGLELDYRSDRGEEPSRDEYASRFADFGPVIDHVLSTHSPERDTRAAGLPGSTASAGAGQSTIRSGSVIGKYVLLEELGRGGMGVVFKARQTDLNRIVAVKMLLAGQHAAAEEFGSFRSEAEAVAQLQHPHIVQIFEIGEHTGQPFFSLEFMDGGHLGQKINGTPQPPRQAGEWAQTLALAIQAAHQRGIIHRDLKPGNILLNAAGTLKITDFGLAKRLDGESRTISGAVIGTPSYMAPEQASGGSKRIGAAADIYGLGAVLYELLTGRPPFRGETPWDTVLQVLDQEPVPPARLAPKVPRDLETICLKCLQKDPARRYATCQSLADDLGRFLAGEPILARPTTAAEKAWKWARRRPAVASLAAAFLLTMIGGLISTTSLWLVAEKRRGEATEASTLAENRRKLADETSRQARAAIRDNFIVATESAEFQRDGMQRARAILLDKALAYFNNFATLRQNDPALKADVADAHRRVGFILALQGSPEKALEAYDDARALYENLLKAKPSDSQAQYWLADMLGDMASQHSKLGQFNQAFKLQNRSLEMSEKLARRDAKNTDFEYAAARSRLSLGLLHVEKSEFKTALNELELARQRLKQLDKSDNVQKSYANCLVAMGHAHWNLGAPAKAVDFYQQAIDLREQLVERNQFPNDRSELARAYGSLGQAHSSLGAHPQALVAYRRSKEEREKLAARNPAVLEYRYDLALSYKNIADTLEEGGKFDESFPLRQKELEHFTAVAQASPGSINYARAMAIAHTDLAYIYRKVKNQPELALVHLTEATGILNDVVQRDRASPDLRFTLAQNHEQVALLHLFSGDFPKALTAYQQSNQILDELLKAGNGGPGYLSQLAKNSINMAYCCQQLGRLEEGLRLTIKALVFREKLAEDYPQMERFREILPKTRDDLASGANLCVETKLPLAPAADPAAQRMVWLARKAEWQRWAAEFPGIAIFAARAIECDAQIAKLAATQD